MVAVLAVWMLIGAASAASVQDEPGCSPQQLFVFVLDASSSMQSNQVAGGGTRWERVLSDFIESVRQIPTDGSAKVAFVVFAGDVSVLPLDSTGQAKEALSEGAAGLFDARYRIDGAAARLPGDARLKPHTLDSAKRNGLLEFLERLKGASGLPSSTNCYDAMGVSLQIVLNWMEALKGEAGDARLTFYTDGQQSRLSQMYYPFGGRTPEEVRAGRRAAWTSPFESSNSGEWASAKRRFLDGALVDTQALLNSIRMRNIPLLISTLSIGREAESREREILPLDPDHRKSEGLVEFSAAPLSKRRAWVDFDIRTQGGSTDSVIVTEAELKAGSAIVPLDLLMCVFDPASRGGSDNVRFEWRPLEGSSTRSSVSAQTIDGLRSLPLQSGRSIHPIELRITNASPGERLRGVLSFVYPDVAEGAAASTPIEIRAVAADLPRLQIAESALLPSDRSLHVLSGETVEFSVPVPAGATATWTIADEAGGATRRLQPGEPHRFEAPSGRQAEHIVRLSVTKDGHRPFEGEWRVIAYGIDVTPSRVDPQEPLYVGSMARLQPSGEVSLDRSSVEWQWLRREGGGFLPGAAGEMYRVPIEGGPRSRIEIGLNAIVNGNRLPYANGTFAPRTMVLEGFIERPVPEIQSVQPPDSVVLGKSFVLKAAVRGARQAVRSATWQFRPDGESGLWTDVPTNIEGEAVWEPRAVGRYSVRFKLEPEQGEAVADEYPSSLECRDKVLRITATTPIPDRRIELPEGQPSTFEVLVSGDVHESDRVAFYLDGQRVGSLQRADGGPVSISVTPPATTLGGRVEARLIGADGRTMESEGRPLLVAWDTVTVPARVSAEIQGVQNPIFGSKEPYRVVIVGNDDGIEVEWQLLAQCGLPFATEVARSDREVELLFDQYQGEHLLSARLFRRGPAGRVALGANEQPPSRKLSVVARAGLPRFVVTDGDPPADDKQLVEGGMIGLTAQDVGSEDVRGLEVRVVGPDGGQVHPPSKVERGLTRTFAVPAVPGRYLVEARAEVPGDGRTEPRWVLGQWQTVDGVDCREVRYSAVCTTPEIDRVSGRPLHFEMLRESERVGPDYSVAWRRRLKGDTGEGESIGEGATVDEQFRVGIWEIIASVTAGGRMVKHATTIAVTEPAWSIVAGKGASGEGIEFSLKDGRQLLDNVTGVEWIIEARHEGSLIKIYDRSTTVQGGVNSPTFPINAPDLELRVTAWVSVAGQDPFAVIKESYVTPTIGYIILPESLPMYVEEDEVLKVEPAPVGAIAFEWTGWSIPAAAGRSGTSSRNRQGVTSAETDSVDARSDEAERVGRVETSDGLVWRESSDSPSHARRFDEVGPHHVSVELVFPVGEDDPATGSRRIAVRRTVEGEVVIDRRPDYVPAMLSLLLGGVFIWVFRKLGLGTQSIRRHYLEWTAIAPSGDEDAPLEIEAWGRHPELRRVWLGQTYGIGGWRLRSFWTKSVRVPIAGLFGHSHDADPDREPRFAPPDWFRSGDAALMGDIELCWRNSFMTFEPDCIRSTHLIKMRGSSPIRFNGTEAEYSGSVYLSDGGSGAKILIRLYKGTPECFSPSVDIPLLHKLLWTVFRTSVARILTVLWVAVTLILYLNA
jgi:hypothetical protein